MVFAMSVQRKLFQKYNIVQENKIMLKERYIHTEEKPKATILLVDDIPGNLIAIEAVLAEMKENLVSVSSGSEALRYLLEHDDVAVILLDVQMPEMDGFETARYIHDRDRLKDVPIILLTAIYKTDEFMERGYESGAVDYLIKPFNPKILKSKVSVFVELHKRRIAQQRMDQENLLLAKVKASLVDKLTDNEREIKRINDNLSLSNHELEAFAYSASHDLRTPLRHIQTFISLLKEESAGLTPKQNEYFTYITEAATHMNDLIEDLLSLSRIGWSKIQPIDINMDLLVQDVILELKSHCEGRSIEWKCGSLGTISGDSNLLRIVFMNLIGNAVKYTSKRETANIEIGTIHNQPDELTFFVRDNGAGFDMKFNDQLFGPFQRLHSNADFEGTGIGLAIVRRIISCHGGKTWAEGEVDKGATMFFTLPVNKT